MVYKIKWTKKAEKQFSKLDRTTKGRIIKSLDSITDDPFLYTTKLAGFNAFKLRVGNYRIILGIENNICVILVLLLDHRKKIYKNLR